MSPIATTIEVDRPAKDVFAYVTDPTRPSARKEMLENLNRLKQRLESQR